MATINVSYHDMDGGQSAPIKVRLGAASPSCPYCYLSIGYHLDIYMTRERITELRDATTAYLEPPAVEPAPVDPRPQYLGVAKVEMPNG